jgi:hypothetical protein
VELVAVGDGLSGLVSHVRVPRREEVPNPRDRERRHDDARDGGDERDLIPPRGEDLGQRLGLCGAGDQLPRPCYGTVMPHPRPPKRFRSQGADEIRQLTRRMLSTNFEGVKRNAEVADANIEEHLTTSRNTLLGLPLLASWRSRFVEPGVLEHREWIRQQPAGTRLAPGDSISARIATTMPAGFLVRSRGTHYSIPCSPPKTSPAASIVRSISASRCAMERNAASNCDGAK